MNFTNLGRAPGPTAGAEGAALDAQALIAQLGSEVATTLSAALERVATLGASGQVDRDSLRSLRDEIDRARRAGIMGQQVVRLASGHVQQTRERLDFTALMREALRQRGREIDARGIEVRQVFSAAEVTSDATLLFTLLQTVLDWSFEHAVTRIDLAVAVTSWPAHAHLKIAFGHRPADEVDLALARHVAEEPRLNTMSWRLLQQTAQVLGLPLKRSDTVGTTKLDLEFPDTEAPRLRGVPKLDTADGTAMPLNSQPLAGRHVLVLTGRREVRNTVREALRPMGLMVDFVGSVEEAHQTCADGVPHALIYEASLGGYRFEQLRAELLAEVPGLTFIQIAEQGRALEVLNAGGSQFTSVGRDAIIEALPAALFFELSRHE